MWEGHSDRSAPVRTRYFLGFVERPRPRPGAVVLVVVQLIYLYDVLGRDPHLVGHEFKLSPSHDGLRFGPVRVGPFDIDAVDRVLAHGVQVVEEVPFPGEVVVEDEVPGDEVDLTYLTLSANPFAA